MPTITSWEELNNNQEFQALSYNDQLAVREKYLTTKLPQNQQWLQMSPEDKQAVFQKYLYSAPQTGSDRQKEFEDLYNRILANDPEAQKEGLRHLTTENLRDQMSILDALSWVTRKLSPEEEAEGEPDFFGYRNSVRDKELAGLRFALSRDQQTATKVKRRNLMSTVGGVLLDTALWYGVTAPLGLALQGATKGGQVAKAFTAGQKLNQTTAQIVAGLPDDLAKLYLKSPGVGRYMQLKLVPEALDAVRGGAIEVVRQNILGNVEAQLSEDPDLWERVQKNTAIFGEDFLYGMAGYFGLSLLTKGGKTIGGMAKGVFDTANLKKFTGGDTYEEFVSKVTAGMYTPDEIAKMSPEAKAVVKRSQDFAEIQKNVDEITDPATLMEIFAAKNWIQFEPVKGGKAYKVLDLTDPKGVEKVLSKEDALRKVGDILDQRAIPDSALEGHAVQAMNDNTLKIHQTVSTSADNLTPDAKILAGMTRPIDGRINRNNALYVIKKLTEDMGVDQKIVDDIVFVDNGARIRIGDNKPITVPATVVSIAQEEKYISTLLRGVERVLKKQNLPTEKLEEFRRLVEKDRLNGGMTPLWVKFQAQRLGYEIIPESGGRLSLVDLNTGVKTQPFSGYMTAGDFLYDVLRKQKPKEFNSQIKANALQEFGDNITFHKDGKVSVARWDQPYKKQNVTTFDSVSDLLKKNPQYVPMSPVSTMPRWNITDNTKGFEEIDIVNGVVTGNTAGIMAWQNTFKDYDNLINQKVLKKTDTKVLSQDKLTKKFTITDSSANFTYHTSDPAKVKEWLGRTYNDFDQISTLAAEKGARAVPFRGQFIVYQARGANPQVAKTMEEFRLLVRDLPVQDYIGTEMTDLTRASVDMGRHLDTVGLGMETKPLADYNQATIRAIEEGRQEGFLGGYRKKAGEDINPLGTFALQKVGPVDIFMKRLAAENKSPELYQRYFELRKAQKRMEGMYYTFSDGFERHVMSNLTKKENVRLNQAMQMIEPGKGIEEAYQKIHGEAIPAKTLEAATRTREILNELSKVFEVDGWKWLEEYYPRIVKHAAEKVPTDLTGDAADYLRKNLFDGNRIPEVEFFARNLRAGDVISGTYFQNFSDVITHYVRQGFRSRVLNEEADKIWGFLKKNHKTLNERSITALSHYTERIMGFFDDKDIKDLNTTLAKASRGFMNELQKNKLVTKVLSPKELENVLGFLNSVTISATMAYRPWPVIRNLFQPFNTLGYVVSQDAVMDGMKAAINNPAKRVARLRKLGIAAVHDHMIEYTTDSAFRTFTRKGLHMYGSADAFNRAVTDATAESLLTNAWIKFQKTQDMDEFLKNSKLSRIDMQDRLLVTQKLEEGNLEEAIDVFSDLLNHRTQFPYKTWENPEAFQGALGKIFGAYQHYPIYYTANILEGLRHGSWGEKIEHALSTAVTGAAAYTVFNNILGINAQDFLWYTPVSFTGGPIWQVMNDLLDLTAGGYEGEVALDQLKRNIPSLFVPGAGMGSDFIEAIGAFLDGDIRLFYTKLLSAPVGGNF